MKIVTFKNRSFIIYIFSDFVFFFFKKKLIQTYKKYKSTFLKKNLKDGIQMSEYMFKLIYFNLKKHFD